MGSRSPLRSGRRKADVHRTSCAPSTARKDEPKGSRSPRHKCLVGRFDGKRFTEPFSDTVSPHQLQKSLSPWAQGLRSAPVGAKPTSTGRRAPHQLHSAGFWFSGSSHSFPTKIQNDYFNDM